MLNCLNKIAEIAATEEFKNQFLGGKFGIEKENLRVDEDGHLSLQPHPELLGNKNDHPYITTDFSESQIEMITPPMASVHEAYCMLETIHTIVLENIGDELLWLQSMPPLLPPEAEIEIAKYGVGGEQKEIYRQFLADTYGRQRLLISGVHFNFSLPESLLHQLHQGLEQSLNFEMFRAEIYLRMVRNFTRYRWLLVWLLGKSPTVHEDFTVKSLQTGEQAPIDCDDSLSIRTCPAGYRNKDALYPDFSSVSAWKKSMQVFIDEDKLSSEKELYAPIRIKFEPDQERISHLEVRVIDLDPFAKIGINEIDLHFVHLFLLFCLLLNEDDGFGAQQQEIVNANQDKISCHGLGNDVLLTDFTGQEVTPKVWAGMLLTKMEKMFSPLNLSGHGLYSLVLAKFSALLESPDLHPARLLLQGVASQGYVLFHMDKARNFKAESLAQGFRFYGNEDLELSTQLLLKEAVLQGIEFEIIDRQENFVRFTKDGVDRFVMQATRTCLDNYSSVLMMENKLVTKNVLSMHGLRVPQGRHYTTPAVAQADFVQFQNRAIVVKPKSTNFGLGITILKANNDLELFRKAVEIAFGYDNTILIENFEAGREFRFFVLNDEVVGVLLRVPANVKGDGTHSIRELVEYKNSDPLRGKGYRTPLEKIELGDAEEMFLTLQQLDFDYIPEVEEIVFLRENSNISTGGDSIDYTDKIDPTYKALAVKACQALDVVVTGLDMMIPNIKVPATTDNYAIIEMNFNPAIHIHCYPFQGENRPLNKLIIDALWT